MAVDTEVDLKMTEWEQRKAARAEEPKPVNKYPFEKAIPAFDRILVRVLPVENKSLIQTASAFEEPSNLGVVISKGQAVFLGGHILDIPFEVGDVVRFGITAMEDAPEFGEREERIGFIRAQDVRCFWRP